MSFFVDELQAVRFAAQVRREVDEIARVSRMIRILL